MQNETITVQRATNPIIGFWRHPLVQAFFNDPVTLVSAFFLAVIVLAVIFAPLVAPHDPSDRQVQLRHVAPLSWDIAMDRTASPPVEDERFFLLGTDHLGRDMLSRLVYGGRLSITVGLLGVLVSGTIGIFLGLIAGYYRGVVGFPLQVCGETINVDHLEEGKEVCSSHTGQLNRVPQYVNGHEEQCHQG